MLSWLPWQDAAVVAGLCGAATVALGPSAHRGSWTRHLIPWTRELALMFVLYGLWQLAGDLSVSQASGAVARGRDIWDAERWLHLPSERSIQRLILPYPDLACAADEFYAQCDVPGLGIALVWMFARHRLRYPTFRNAVVGVTGAALLIQLVPVAPPRLVPGLGMVDLGHRYGMSVYPQTVQPGLDQLSSMPSLHVGWAVLAAGAVVWSLRTGWRWLAVLYPASTYLVVVATANHYWADGLVAIVLCALSVWPARRLALWAAAHWAKPPDGTGAPLPRPVGPAGVPQRRASGT